MPTPNISATLTAAQKTTIKSNLAAIAAIINNFSVNLTPKQRKTLFKMGPKSVSYVQLALQIAKNNPAILPSGFNVTEFEKDVILSADLVDVESVAKPFAEGISDTLLAVGTEAIKQANQLYALVKVAAKSDANMDSLRKQLGERYKKAGKTTPTPATT